MAPASAATQAAGAASRRMRPASRRRGEVFLGTVRAAAAAPRNGASEPASVGRG
jgi:hypothetical protein